MSFTLRAPTCAAAAGVALLLSYPAAAQQDWKTVWDQTVARAKGQTLAVVTHPNEGHAPVIDEFRKRFPDIKVEHSNILPSAMAPRMLLEQKNGIFAWDSWWSPTSNMNSLVLPAGGFEKLPDYLILPEVKDEVNWYAPKYSYTSDRGPYIFEHTFQVQLTNYRNTDVAKEVDVRTADGLLDPRLKGKITVRDPTQANAGAMSVSGLYRIRGADFVRRLLGEMQPVVVVNPRQAADALIRGEAAVGIGMDYQLIAKCQLDGGCKNIARLPFGVYALSTGVGVPKNPPHPDAAKVWVNWILSKDGQEAYVRNWARFNDAGALSRRKDVAPHPDHLDSVPDYARMEDYVLVATDYGDPEMNAVMDIAKSATGGKN